MLLSLLFVQISVLAPEGSSAREGSTPGRHEDLSQIPATSSSQLPASLLSRLSLVKPDDDGTNESAAAARHNKPLATEPAASCKGINARRPLIQEL